MGGFRLITNVEYEIEWRGKLYWLSLQWCHISVMASQITTLWTVCSATCSDLYNKGDIKALPYCHFVIGFQWIFHYFQLCTCFITYMTPLKNLMQNRMNTECYLDILHNPRLAKVWLRELCVFGLGNGLWHIRIQAIALVVNYTLRDKTAEILIHSHTVLLKKLHLKKLPCV